MKLLGVRKEFMAARQTRYNSGRLKRQIQKIGVEMEAFLELVKNNGIEGLVVGLFVLGALYVASKSGLAVTHKDKVLGNLILAALGSGLSLQGNTSDEVLVAAIASLGSALAYEGIRYLGKLNAPKG